MKKILVVMTFLVLGVLIAGCYPVLGNENDKYYVTGYLGMDDSLVVEMEAIAFNDERISSISSKFEGVYHLYIAEVTISDTNTGTNIKYNKDSDAVDSKYALYVIKSGDSGYKAQSFESGKVENATFDTVFVPSFNTEKADGVTPNWDLPFIAYKTAKYYCVFGEVGGGVKVFGLIEVV